jgi:L-rhamnose mutarotase
MIRNAFVMKLKPGFEAEYKRRHDEIWPELSQALSEAGVRDYSIYLDERTLYLFAFQRLEENHTSAQLPQHPVVRKWWAYMRDVMDYNDDGTPVALPLREVFHMD